MADQGAVSEGLAAGIAAASPEAIRKVRELAGEAAAAVAGYGWEQPRVRYCCPLHKCTWVHDDAWADTSGRVISSKDDTIALLKDHYAALNDTVRAHLETHSLLEWVTEVQRLRGVIDLTAISLSDSGQIGAFIRSAAAPGSPVAAARAECLERLR